VDRRALGAGAAIPGEPAARARRDLAVALSLAAAWFLSGRIVRFGNIFHVGTWKIFRNRKSLR
jgi:hypothetical protein